MNRNRLVALFVLAALTCIPLDASRAGGWASVEIVDGPDFLEARKPATLGLVIKQHGVTPVDIDPLVISATNAVTDEEIEEHAAKAEGEGNYTVELTFPSEGTWDMRGTAGGFEPFDMGPVNVGQALGASSLAAPGGALIIDIVGEMGGGEFEPGTLTITRGTMVVWTNNSVEGHTIEIVGEKATSGLIAPGGAFAMVFDEPGTYRYFCGPHPNMKGEIEVS